MHLSDEHFRGRTVIGSDGQAIGEVAGLLLDTATWTIVALQVKLNKTVAEHIGAARSLIRAATLEVPVRAVQSVGDTVLLSVPTLELRQMLPEFAERHQEHA
jgi:sporulation protein YlmC with PRC-barrel domain